jgi:hypothetical protein
MPCSGLCQRIVALLPETLLLLLQLHSWPKPGWLSAAWFVHP